MLFAATYPQRTVALILFGTWARVRRDVDYPFGDEETLAELYRILDDGWGTGESLRVFGPSLLEYEPLREHMGRIERTSGSPGTIRAMLDALADIDVRAVLPMISAPTLVVHTTNDTTVSIDNGRYLADHIAGARFVELPGEHIVFDLNRFADEVESFLTGRRHPITTAADRVLATVLFTDIVSSTEHAAALGDRRWRALIDQHDTVVSREIATYGGRLIGTTGDGVLATFDGPGRAIRCATALRDDLRLLGLEIRAGLHTGEVENTGAGIAGIGVHIAARVLDQASAGQVLTSAAVPMLVAGSGIQFDDRGEHTLKGVPGTWRLFAVERS
jgi:class 3 adenylate cyclase